MKKINKALSLTLFSLLTFSSASLNLSAEETNIDNKQSNIVIKNDAKEKEENDKQFSPNSSSPAPVQEKKADNISSKDKKEIENKKSVTTVIENKKEVEKKSVKIKTASKQNNEVSNTKKEETVENVPASPAPPVSSKNQPQNQTKEGWKNVSGKWIYNDTNGNKVVGWKVIKNEKYHFDTSGFMETGWKLINGNWYCFNGTGKMYKSWHYLGNSWYYFDNNGIMQKGLHNLNGVWNYFDNNGKMLTGWQKIGNIWHYFNSNGAMQKGWKLVKSKWYYFDFNGNMQHGWQKIGNVWYYFDNSGKMYTSWHYLGKHWYYFDNSGKMYTKWHYLGHNWYYFDNSGSMYTKWHYLGNSWYHFSNNGSMNRGSVKISNKWYYFGPNGNMQHGWKHLGRRWYWYNHSGSLYTKVGWEKYHGHWMYSAGEYGYFTSEYKGSSWLNRYGYWVDTSKNRSNCGDDGQKASGTYVSVNKSSQSYCVFKNGKFVRSGRVVTGDHSKGRDTSSGWHRILAKKYKTVLDGSTVGTGNDYNYKIPVTYWMPFTPDGQGLHDLSAAYRSDWSSKAYTYGAGSHGCVNMHYADAKAVWNLVSVGTWVYVHN